MAHDAAHARAIHELGNESGIVVPLTARGRTFGAITFGTVPPQPRVQRVRLRARDRARAARLRRTRQRAPAPGGRGTRPCGRRPRVRRRRRVPRRRRRESSASGTPPRRRPSASSRRRRSAGTIDELDQRLGDGSLANHAGRRADGRREPSRDAARRRAGRRALALDLGGALPRRHRLRVPRRDRGARGRAAEERLRLDDLARAAHAARRDLRRRADAAARRRAPRWSRSGSGSSTSSPARPTASRASSTTSCGRAGSTRARWASRS